MAVVRSICRLSIRSKRGYATAHCPAERAFHTSQGDPLLRDQLAAYLLDRGVEARPEQIVVVGGALQGIDIALRALVQPGETVLVEHPTYLGVIERSELQGIALHGVPMGQEGSLLDALEQAILRHRSQLLYLVPTYHNPTGSTMSDVRKEGLLSLAARYRLVTLEDDIYGALPLDGAAPLPLKARDAVGSVIYLSSTSAELSSGDTLGHARRRFLAVGRAAAGRLRGGPLPRGPRPRSWLRAGRAGV